MNPGGRRWWERDKGRENFPFAEKSSNEFGNPYLLPYGDN